MLVDYLKNLKNPEEEMGYLATDVLFGFILSERIKGTEPRFLAYAFHVLLADMINESCTRARKKSEINTVALSGGCFQNTLLLSFTEALLERNGFLVLKHSMIPPNDGGIAIGQALFGMYNRS